MSRIPVPHGGLNHPQSPTAMSNFNSPHSQDTRRKQSKRDEVSRVLSLRSELLRGSASVRGVVVSAVDGLRWGTVHGGMVVGAVDAVGGATLAAPCV
ncbi:hypothetical protein IAR50_003474 [Cryptococcus sp. DSM 104548]